MTARLLFFLLSAASPAVAQCLAVSGNRILAGDLARAIPAFGALAPQLTLGYAPAAGARRSYGAAELARLAARYGLALAPGTEACFVRSLQTLTQERVEAAIRAVLPDANMRVVSFSEQPVPQGELRFSLSGLQAGPQNSGPSLWRGTISAAGQDDFPVWAKVRIRIQGKRTIAVQALPAGVPVVRAQLREEEYEGPPGLPEISQVEGRIPRRPIPEGMAIQPQWLDAPAEILRGERVRVEVLSGRARVLLEGQAQATGRRGQVIAVRNPVNGRILHATVSGRGVAALVADAPGSAQVERGIR